jgi:uncharacterized protein YcbX
MSVGGLGGIWRFPVKSMRGERLERAEVGTGGIDGDRSFAVRDTTTGKVASAKQPRAWGRLLDFSAVGIDDGRAATVTVPDARSATTGTPDLDVLLSDVLGTTVAVVAADGSEMQYESEWPDIEGLVMSNASVDLPVAMATEKTSFVDLAAFHLVTTASLAALAALAPESAVDLRRFRPNLVVDTGTAAGFVETDWVGRRLALGDEVVLRVTDNATRCVMTTLAQGDLPCDRAVLQTLARENQQEFGGLGRSACLGVYAEVETGGTIHAGDAVTLLDA